MAIQLLLWHLIDTLSRLNTVFVSKLWLFDQWTSISINSIPCDVLYHASTNATTLINAMIAMIWLNRRQSTASKIASVVLLDTFLCRMFLWCQLSSLKDLANKSISPAKANNFWRPLAALAIGAALPSLVENDFDTMQWDLSNTWKINDISEIFLKIDYHILPSKGYKDSLRSHISNWEMIHLHFLFHIDANSDQTKEETESRVNGNKRPKHSETK